MERAFVGRVRETTLGVAGVLLLVLCSLRDGRPAFSFSLGVGLALFLWWTLELLVCTPPREQPRARDIVRAVGLYSSPLALSAFSLWSAVRLGWLAPAAFVGGFGLPTVVVLLKAVALGRLPAECPEAAVYSVDRKAVAGG